MGFSGVFRKESRSTWSPTECSDGGVKGGAGAYRVELGAGVW